MGLLLTLTLLTVLLGALVATVLLTVLRPPPPLAYTHRYYAPARAVLCPGDALQWTPTLTVQDAGYISILRTYWDRTRNQAAVLRDGQPAPSVAIARNLPAELSGQPRANTVTLTVPDLSPGAYWLVTSARGSGGAQATYQVPFVVRACD